MPRQDLSPMLPTVSERLADDKKASRKKCLQFLKSGQVMGREVQPFVSDGEEFCCVLFEMQNTYNIFTSRA